jgi:hypothetical protein
MRYEIGQPNFIQVVCAGGSSNEGGHIFPSLSHGKVAPDGEVIPV